MRALCSLLLLLSVAGIIGGIGTLIYRKIKNKEKGSAVKIIVGSVMLLFVSIIAMPDFTPEEKARHEQKAAEKQTESKRIEEQKQIEQAAIEERKQQEETEINEEQRRKLESENAEKARIEKERQEEIELQQQANKIREEQSNIIRQINMSLGGGDHLVSVDGFESKTIMFQLDVGTKDIETAKEISADAIYKVIGSLSNYKIDKITVIAVDKGAPVGLFSYDENGITLLTR